MRVLFLIVTTMFLLCADIGLSAGTLVSKAYAASDKEKPEFEYFELSPLLIPAINAHGLTQQVSMIVSIEVPAGKLEEVSAYGPRLTDAYIQDMYGVLGAGYGLVNGNVLNIQAIKQRLGAVTRNILGEERVQDVLLQVVQQRPL